MAGKKFVWINGKRFEDVTDQTTGRKTYNYTEAYYYTLGKSIASSK